MIVYAISAVKTALLGLKDASGAAIFVAAEDIWTGFPNPDLLRPDMPTAGKPVVAVHFHASEAHSLGYREFLGREDYTDGSGYHHKLDVAAVARATMQADVHVLAATSDELAGTKAPLWAGYVEQIILLVASHAAIVGPGDTPILWDVASWDIPGTVLDAQDRRLQYALVKTTLGGRFLPTAPLLDGAKITELYPHDGAFVPEGPP